MSSRFLLIRDILFPNVHWITKEAIESTLDYIPKDGDVVIASYPKTGTTWLYYIVLQIISKGEYFPEFNDIHARSLMEMIGAEGIDNLTDDRIYKHHYRYDMVKKNPKSKVLYIYRKPEDTFVSYYHFMSSAYQEQLDLEDFFEGFMTGNIEYGSYFEHVLSFIEHKYDENLLLISYENLHADPKEGILRIAKFLGEDYYQDLITEETLLNRIVNNTSFDHMKKNLKFERPPTNSENSSENPKTNIHLFRKGVVGDGKSFLSERYIEQLREKSANVMKGTDILKEWIKE